MPFTFSHPAAVLLLKRLSIFQKLCITGLVIGSLAPDFEYFIHMKMQGQYGHRLDGLFWFDLPLSILFAFIFHNLMRDSLLDNLPASLKLRLIKFKEFNWNEYFKKNYFIVILSVLIGAFSHIFIDAFTHKHGYFVEIIPVLKNELEIIDRNIPIFRILQQLTGLIGLFIIIFMLHKLSIDNKINIKNIKSSTNVRYWLLVTCLTFVIIIIRLLFGLDFKRDYLDIIPSVISAFLISLTLTPILINNIKRINIILFVFFLVHSWFVLTDGLLENLRPADVGVIMGSQVKRTGIPSKRLKSRLERGIDLYNKKILSVLIVSGGFGKEGFDEAKVMKDYLKERGIPDVDIITDPNGNNSYLTAKNCSKIMKEKHWKSVIIISDYFHLSRTKLAFEKFGVKDVRSSFARGFPNLFLNAFSTVREFFGFYYYLLRDYQK